MVNSRQGEPPSTQRENHLSSLKIYDGKKRWDVLCVCCFFAVFSLACIADIFSARIHITGTLSDSHKRGIGNLPQSLLF